jgi:hypothetical protein
MERFAAMVAGRRATAEPAPAEEVVLKEKGKEDEPYLSIQLEEIVVVKNEDIGCPGATRGSSSLGGGAFTSPLMGHCTTAAAAAPPAGTSTAWRRAAR